MILSLCNLLTYTQAEHEAYCLGNGPSVEEKCRPLCPIKRVQKPPLGQRDNWIGGCSAYYFAALNDETGKNEWTFCCLSNMECPHRSDEKINLKRLIKPSDSIPAGKYGLCVVVADEPFTPIAAENVELRSCVLRNVEVPEAIKIGAPEFHVKTEEVFEKDTGLSLGWVDIQVEKQEDGSIVEKDVLHAIYSPEIQ